MDREELKEQLKGENNMKKWRVIYCRYPNFYAHKFVYANTNSEAIKKARVKTIVDLYPVEESNEPKS